MRRFLPMIVLALIALVSLAYTKQAFASYTCDRACDLCEIGKTVDCSTFDYAECMEPVYTLPGGIDQPDSPLYKGWAACQRMGSFCAASDRDSVCDLCNNWCKSEASPPQAPSAESMDNEAEKKNGCLSGAASGDTWDDGILMCRCGEGRTLNAEHTLCIPREADTKPICVDMDKGPNEFVFGEVTVQVEGVITTRSQDECVDAGTLDEKDCDGSGNIISRTVSCQCGCSSGQCNPCGSVADFIRDPGDKECMSPIDCENRSTPTYGCREKDLYTTLPSFLCVESKCVKTSETGNSKLVRTCQESCVDGFCYSKAVEVHAHNPCERDHDCPVIVIGKSCLEGKNSVVYGFASPSCVNEKCDYLPGGEVQKIVPCLGDEKCTELSGKFQCVISDSK